MHLRTGIAVLAAVVVLAAGVVGFNLADRKPVLDQVEVVAPSLRAASVVGSWPQPTAPAQPKSEHATSFEVADAIVPVVQLYSAPDVPMDPKAVDVPRVSGAEVHNPTWEGLPVLFLVKESKGDWLDVEVSARPNGLRAWIKAEDVSVRTVPNWIRVELGARKATLFHGDETLMTSPVVIGRESAPTPTGVYFVDGIVHLDDTSGPYGIAQMSVSAFSDIYQSFGGGVGQIALHGTNAPGLMGQAVSHGCVRFTNEDLAVLLFQAPTGTPVEILP